MASRATPDRRHGQSFARRLVPVIAALVWLTALPSPVRAHVGAMTADDFRPIAVSAVVALVSYWLVLLWPSRPPKAQSQSRWRHKNRSHSVGPGEPSRPPHGLRPVPNLKEVGGRYGRDSATRE